MRLLHVVPIFRWKEHVTLTYIKDIAVEAISKNRDKNLVDCSNWITYVFLIAQ